MTHNRHSEADSTNSRDAQDGKQAGQNADLHANLLAEGYPGGKPKIYTDTKGEVHNREVEQYMGTQSQFVDRTLKDFEHKYKTHDPAKIFDGLAKDAYEEYMKRGPKTQEKYRHVLGLADGEPVTRESIAAAQMNERKANLGLKDPNDLTEMMNAYLKRMYREAGIDYN